MLAIWSGIPEIELEPDEAKKMETAIKRVTKHYPVNVSQKHVDMTYLVYTLGTIYGTRAVAIYAARKAQPSQANPNTSNVFDFNATG